MTKKFKFKDWRPSEDKEARKKIDRLMDALDLTFVPASVVLVDGWYLWRNQKGWAAEDYAFKEFCEGEMTDIENACEYGILQEQVWCKPYGELAGPIIDR